MATKKITKKPIKSKVKKKVVARGARKKKPLTKKQVLEMRVDYEAGILSLEKIGKKYKITRAAVLKRANTLGWKKENPRKKLNKDVIAKLAKSAAKESKTVNDEVNAKTEDYMDAYSDHLVLLTQKQQADVSRNRSLVDKLAQKAEAIIERCETEIEEQADIIRKNNKLIEEHNKKNPGKSKPLKPVTPAIQNAGMLDLIATTANKLSAATDKLVKLERTIHGIDNDASESTSYDDLID